jgi:uncharacterized integral membrane protein
VIERHADDQGGISPRLIIAAVVVVLALVFVLSNLGTVSLNFLFLHFEIPAFLMFVLMLLAGAALDRLFLWWWPRRKRKAALPPPPPPT